MQNVSYLAELPSDALIEHPSVRPVATSRAPFTMTLMSVSSCSTSAGGSGSGSKNRFWFMPGSSSGKNSSKTTQRTKSLKDFGRAILLPKNSLNLQPSPTKDSTTIASCIAEVRPSSTIESSKINLGKYFRNDTTQKIDFGDNFGGRKFSDEDVFDTDASSSSSSSVSRRSLKVACGLDRESVVRPTHVPPDEGHVGSRVVRRTISVGQHASAALQKKALTNRNSLDIDSSSIRSRGRSRKVENKPTVPSQCLPSLHWTDTIFVFFSYTRHSS